MKKVKGIFDPISDEFHPGVSDKIKAIKDQIIYSSQSQKAKQMPIDANDVKNQITEKLEQLRGDLLSIDSIEGPDKLLDISKDDMSNNLSQKKEALLDPSPNKKAQKKEKEDDLMTVESKQWKDKFNLGFDI